MTHTAVNLEAALKNNLPFIFELWISLDVAFKLKQEGLL